MTPDGSAPPTEAEGTTVVPEGQPAPTDPGEHAHGHPTELQYIKVALILAVVTALEVGVYYVPAIRGVLVPLLLSFAVVKFALVVLWFMHLRFDSRIFRRLFVTGLILAIAVYVVVLMTFHVFTR